MNCQYLYINEVKGKNWFREVIEMMEIENRVLIFSIWIQMIINVLSYFKKKDYKYYVNFSNFNIF